MPKVLIILYVSIKTMDTEPEQFGGSNLLAKAKAGVLGDGREPGEAPCQAWNQPLAAGGLLEL